jgi:hypothetical protein
MSRLPRSALVLAWAVVCFANGSLCFAQEINSKSFVEHYRREVVALTKVYQQVHVVAVLTENNLMRHEKKEYDVEFFASGKEKSKVVLTNRSTGARTVIVANPEKETSFILDRLPGRTEYTVSNLDSEPDSEMENVLVWTQLIHAPFYYYSIPLTDFFSPKRTTIQDVKKETINGKRLIRVFSNYQSVELRNQKCDGIEGSFLLDPDAFWAVQAYELKRFFENRSYHLLKKCSIEYSKAMNGMPYVKHAKRQSFTKDGTLDLEDQLTTQSIDFGPVSPEEFTLKKYGIRD